MVNKISDRLIGHFGKDARSYAVHKTDKGFVYVYPVAYGDLESEQELHSYSRLIVVDNTVVKDDLGLYGKGYKFEEEQNELS